MQANQRHHASPQMSLSCRTPPTHPLPLALVSLRFLAQGRLLRGARWLGVELHAVRRQRVGRLACARGRDLVALPHQDEYVYEQE